MEDDEFVFKPAAKQNSYNDSKDSVVEGSKSSVSVLPVNSTITPNNVPTPQTQSNTSSTRYPELDTFIADKKRQMDTELIKLAHERLEQFLNKEKEADRQREEEFASMSLVSSPKTNAAPVLTDELRNETFERKAKEADEREAEMFKEMRAKAKETWKELENDYMATLIQLHQEQSARLAQESQLQESLKASGAIFNRELFEKVVEKCGKGRESAYAKEKMARFWEALERSHPINESEVNNNCTDMDKDKLLTSLLGLNANA